MDVAAFGSGALLALVWRQRHSSLAGLGKANGDGLSCGPYSMLPLAHMVDFFTDKFAGLRAWGEPAALVFFGTIKSFAFWHDRLL